MRDGAILLRGGADTRKASVRRTLERLRPRARDSVPSKLLRSVRATAPVPAARHPTGRLRLAREGDEGELYTVANKSALGRSRAPPSAHGGIATSISMHVAIRPKAAGQAPIAIRKAP